MPNCIEDDKEEEEVESFGGGSIYVYIVRAIVMWPTASFTLLSHTRTHACRT